MVTRTTTLLLPETRRYDRCWMPASQVAVAGPSPEGLLALRLIPKFGDALAQYAIDRHERRIDRADEVVTTAAETLGLDPAALIERIIEDDRLTDLLNDAIQAAARSGLEAKRRALGKSSPKP